MLFEAQSQKAPFWMLLAQMIPLLFLQESNDVILFSLVASIIAISALVHDAYRMAYADTLTGIPSRRALEERFLRLGSNYIIAMVDIDFFKKFNDKFGHDIGDDVLKLVAKELSHVKNGGRAYRYGGEEFTILFSGKKKEDCVMALEELREQIFRRGFVIRDKNRPEKAPKEMQQSNAVKKERLINKSFKIFAGQNVAFSLNITNEDLLNQTFIDFLQAKQKLYKIDRSLLPLKSAVNALRQLFKSSG